MEKIENVYNDWDWGLGPIPNPHLKYYQFLNILY